MTDDTQEFLEQMGERTSIRHTCQVWYFGADTHRCGRPAPKKLGQMWLCGDHYELFKDSYGLHPTQRLETVERND